MAKRILVISHHRDGYGTPLSSLWFSASACNERGIDLEFIHTSNVKLFFKIVFAERILFDGIYALRRGFGLLAYFFALFLGKKVAIFWHETEWELKRALAFRKMRRIFKLQLPFAVKHMVYKATQVFHLHVCEYGAHMLSSKFHIPDHRIAVVYNCIRPSVFNLYDPTLEREKGLFVAVGRVIPRKGVDLFISIAAEVRKRRPDARFVWVGELPADEALMTDYRNQIELFGLNDCVEFAGFQASPHELMAKAEAVLMTSRDEPLTKALSEALALGKKTVSFDVGGIPEVIGDAGYIVPFGDTKTFAEYVSDWNDAASEEIEKERRHKRAVELFTPEKFAQRLETAIEKCDIL